MSALLRYVVAKLSAALVAVVVLLAIVISFGPVVDPGTAAVDERLPNQPPETCVATPDSPVAEETAADVVGSISRHEANGVAVNVTYRRTTAADLEFTVSLPSSASLVDQAGFDRDSEGGLTWNGSSSSHWIHYRIATETDHRLGHGGTWLITRTPAHEGANVSIEPADAGFAGSQFVYLGDYSVRETTVGCQRIEVVAADGVGDSVRVSRRLAELRAAARALPVGHHYRTVRAYVVPDLDGALRGVASLNELVVEATTWWDPSPVWIHEYVHTVQNFTPADDFRWFREASAEYLAYRISVEHGYVSPAYYDGVLARAEHTRWSVPLERSSRNDVAYYRGAALLARLDDDLAARSSASMVDVIAHLNSMSSPGLDELLSYLQTEGNLSDRRLAAYERYVRGSDRFDVPYLLGPSWLPSELRIFLWYAWLPKVRLATAAFLAAVAVFVVMGRVRRAFRFRRGP